MRYLVIQTPTVGSLIRKPTLEVLENVTSTADLKWRLEQLERNDMYLSAVPVVDVLLALGIIEPDEVETVE